MFEKMVYPWKSLVLGGFDLFRTRSKLEGYLLDNDILAVIEELKSGADPLESTEGGEDALLLTLKLFLKHVNKCLMTPVPLGFSDKKGGKHNAFTHTGSDSSGFGSFYLSSENSVNSPVLRGFSNSGGDGSEFLERDGCAEYNLLFKSVSESVASFFDNPRDDELVLALQAKLLRKTRGFLSVLKVMCENPNQKRVARRYLAENMEWLGYPLLYVAVMDYVFKKTAGELKGQRLRINDVWDCRRAYSHAARAKFGGMYVMKFITQVGSLLEELFSLFNEDKELEEGGLRGRLEGRNRIVMDGLNLNIIEMYAHLAFVTNLPMLFCAMILQPKFYGARTQFDWNLLLSNISKRREKFGVYLEPLMRKSLFSSIGSHYEGVRSFSIRS